MIRIAAITHAGETFFARADDASRAAGAPDSAILRLVHGVHRLRPALARKILREPIACEGTPDALDYGALKVGAKRLRASVVTPGESWIELGPLEAVETALPGRLPPPGAPDADWMHVAQALADAVPRSESLPLHAQSRPVGAVLVSTQGEILAWGANAGAENRILHAELAALLAWHERERAPVPTGARLIVTLKPCKLCAGAIWECAADRARLRVVYRDPDPGPMGNRTVLDEGTHERELASGSDAALRGLRIQSQLAFRA